jgi:hypothetical protein
MRRLVILVPALLVLLLLLVWHFRYTQRNATSAGGVSAKSRAAVLYDTNESAASPESTPTTVYAHNLMLRKGPDFRVYIGWLRGQLVRTRSNVNPSFDDPESFFLKIKSGVIRANVGDITNFLNASAVASSPLKNISLSGEGNQLRLRATLHKLISFPIELVGTISAIPENRIQLHVTKLSALKIPLKALFGGLHITVSDLFHAESVSGIQVAGDDIFFDTHKLLPPPHIGGQLTGVRIVNPDLEEIYGNGQDAVRRVEQWRNFLQLSDGTIDFGKLTMHRVDLIMIDLSNDAWFDLDLTHYQDQLVNGYTRMTPQAGLQIFMPDLDELRSQKKISPNVSMEWLKNRNSPPPRDITSK